MTVFCRKRHCKIKMKYREAFILLIMLKCPCLHSLYSYMELEGVKAFKQFLPQLILFSLWLTRNSSFPDLLFSLDSFHETFSLPRELFSNFFPFILSLHLLKQHFPPRLILSHNISLQIIKTLDVMPVTLRALHYMECE